MNKSIPIFSCIKVTAQEKTKKKRKKEKTNENYLNLFLFFFLALPVFKKIILNSQTLVSSNSIVI